MNLVSVTDENYDNSNTSPIAYLNENVQPDDVVVYTDIVNGGVVATLLKNNNQYFLNIENWSVEEAYKAYAPQMKIAYNFEELAKNAKGKIIIIDPSDNKLYNILKEDEQFDSKYKETSFKEYETKYKNYKYNIRILECK